MNWTRDQLQLVTLVQLCKVAYYKNSLIMADKKDRIPASENIIFASQMRLMRLTFNISRF